MVNSHFVLVIACIERDIVPCQRIDDAIFRNHVVVSVLDRPFAAKERHPLIFQRFIVGCESTSNGIRVRDDASLASLCCGHPNLFRSSIESIFNGVDRRFINSKLII